MTNPVVYHCTLPEYKMTLVMTGKRVKLEAVKGLITLTDPEEAAAMDKFIASRSDVRAVVRKIDLGHVDPNAQKRQREILAAKAKPVAVKGAFSTHNHAQDAARKAQHENDMLGKMAAAEGKDLQNDSSSPASPNPAANGKMSVADRIAASKA